MPVIRVQDKIATMQPGEELKAICTDPGVMSDIPAWARINGHTVLSFEQVEDEYIIVVRVEEEQ